MKDFSFEVFYQNNRRLFTWIIFLGLLYLARAFFGLIFLTFVIAFIATPLSQFGQQRLRLPRHLAVVLVFLFFLSLLSAFVSVVAPLIARETTGLLDNMGQTEDRIIDLKNNLDSRYPSLGRVITGYLRGVSGTEEDLSLNQPQPSPLAPAAVEVSPGSQTPPSGSAAGVESEDDRLIRLFITQQVRLIQENAPAVLNAMGRASFTMLLALLFSFLITLDITRLSREVRSLRFSRLHDFYEETAQPIVRFAWVVGRAIQAQAAIACVNTALTLIGLIILGVPSLAVLSAIVFLCSFIPVLGVIISTIPLVLVALNSGGLGQALWVLAIVAVVHAIEAYVLNPLIYGQHLKINPVLVLLILFVGHHTFGVWGMLLGVPVAYYFIHDVFGVPLWLDKGPLPSKPAPPGEDQPASS